MAEEINCGAVDGNFRLYKAKAIREAAETYLLAQERSYAATEARATSLLGWAIAGAVALASRMFVAGFSLPLFVAAFCLFLSALCSCAVLWPGHWNPAGGLPADFAGWKVQSELEFQEWLVARYEADIAANRKVAQHASLRMRTAWLLTFSAAPLAALAALVVKLVA